MTDAVYFLSLTALFVLSYFERRMHAQERARLTKAALAVNPAQAAAAISEHAKGDPDPERQRRPKSIDL